MTPRELDSRIRRSPRRLAVVVVASALLVAALDVGHAASVDAEARTDLRQEAARLGAAIERSHETGEAVVASHFHAAVCVAEVSKRLAPAATADARYLTGSLERASAIVQSATVASPVPAYDPAPPNETDADRGVVELQRAVAGLREELEDSEEEVASLASAARAAEQGCANARSTIVALVGEVQRRTDELIAANAKASADAVAALASARDAVVAAEGGELAGWLGAANALESTHTAAVQAEQAAEAARQAAERTASVPRNPAQPDPAPPYPGDPPGTNRPLTEEELCRLYPSLVRHIDPETGEVVYGCS
jgi:hypothetical protein